MLSEKKDYHDTMQLCDTVEQEFISLLSKEQKSMFQDYKEYATRLTTMENAENYIQGMAMGVRITAEAFTLEDGETE
ncbi:DUF6809 family protein [Blautia obeum]|uniref:DUF6809 family protein n=1 Tax=Blautia obeum TaxID=40520 RepID=UPI00319E266B